MSGWILLFFVSFCLPRVLSPQIVTLLHLHFWHLFFFFFSLVAAEWSGTRMSGNHTVPYRGSSALPLSLQALDPASPAMTPWVRLLFVTVLSFPAS